MTKSFVLKVQTRIEQQSIGSKKRPQMNPLVETMLILPLKMHHQEAYAIKKVVMHTM